MDLSCRNFTDPELVLFKPSPIHGLGAFAKEAISVGTRVLEYKGEVITKSQSLLRCEQNNQFIFSLDEEHDLDGSVEQNPARFINHSCAPNCEAQLEAGRIWLVAIRRINAGEELTFNYGFDLEDYQDYPCHCGTTKCVGFIVGEQFFDHVRKGANQKKPAT